MVNAKTMEPIEGAIVTMPGKDLTGLSTDPDGGFLSYELPPGNQPIMVRHPDYQTAKLQVVIKQGGVVAQDVKLEPAAPRFVKVTGTVTGAKGKGVAATIASSGAESKQVTADAERRLQPRAQARPVHAGGHRRRLPAQGACCSAWPARPSPPTSRSATSPSAAWSR